MICIDKLRQVADSRPAAVNVGIFFQREIGALFGNCFFIKFICHKLAVDKQTVKVKNYCFYHIITAFDGIISQKFKVIKCIFGIAVFHICKGLFSLTFSVIMVS